MKFLLTFLLAIVCLSVEEVVVHYLGLPLVRIDVTVAIVVFLALRANLLEGVISSFTVGYLLDLMSSRPVGLYTFLAVLTFLLARFADAILEVRSRASFVLFAMAADLGHGLVARLLEFVASKHSGEGSTSWMGLPLEAVLTGGAAVLLYPLLKRVTPGSDHAEPGLLR